MSVVNKTIKWYCALNFCEISPILTFGNKSLAEQNSARKGKAMSWGLDFFRNRKQKRENDGKFSMNLSYMLYMTKIRKTLNFT